MARTYLDIQISRQKLRIAATWTQATGEERRSLSSNLLSKCQNIYLKLLRRFILKNVRKTKNMYSTHCTGSIYLNILKFILNQQPAEHQQSIFFFECRYKYLEVKQSNEKQIVQRYSCVFMKTFLQLFKNVYQVFRIFYIYSKRFKIQSTQNVAECNKISKYYEIVFG